MASPANMAGILDMLEGAWEAQQQQLKAVRFNGKYNYWQTLKYLGWKAITVRGAPDNRRVRPGLEKLAEKVRIHETKWNTAFWAYEDLKRRLADAAEDAEAEEADEAPEEAPTREELLDAQAFFKVFFEGVCAGGKTPEEQAAEKQDDEAAEAAWAHLPAEQDPTIEEMMGKWDEDTVKEAHAWQDMMVVLAGEKLSYKSARAAPA